MQRCIGVALAVVALLLPLQDVTAQKSGRSSRSSSRSSSTRSRNTSLKLRTASTKSRKSSVRKSSTVAKRDTNGRIKRSASARADFRAGKGCPPFLCVGFCVDRTFKWASTAVESRPEIALHINQLKLAAPIEIDLAHLSES